MTKKGIFDRHEMERRGERITWLTEVAGHIRGRVPIPVLGIGAGEQADGQPLIVSDVLGAFQAFTPKFVRRYAELGRLATEALGEYVADVRGGRFPGEQHCYRMLEGEGERFAEWSGRIE